MLPVTNRTGTTYTGRFHGVQEQLHNASEFFLSVDSYADSFLLKCPGLKHKCWRKRGHPVNRPLNSEWGGLRKITQFQNANREMINLYKTSVLFLNRSYPNVHICDWLHQRFSLLLLFSTLLKNILFLMTKDQRLTNYEINCWVLLLYCSYWAKI